MHGTRVSLPLGDWVIPVKTYLFLIVSLIIWILIPKIDRILLWCHILHFIVITIEICLRILKLVRFSLILDLLIIPLPLASLNIVHIFKAFGYYDKYNYIQSDLANL